jgi:uncharacterized membrane protein
MRIVPERVRQHWNDLWETLWFLPALISVAGSALAIAMLRLDAAYPRGNERLWFLYTGDADSARDLVAALLSGMITMTALAVSITMVVLTLAAGQLGPRLIRKFISDRVTQGVLGLFIATILYLLIVLRTIHGDFGVPHAAVTLGSTLAGASLFVLLFFVHKLARSTNSDSVVEAVADDLQRGITARLREGEPDTPPAPAAPEDAAWISSGASGYVQAIDLDELVGAAQEAEAVLHVLVRPGHFVLAEARCVAAAPAKACSDALRDRVRAAFVVGKQRTPGQDLEYDVRQLVEIALRALSPGINDPFTAIAVIDHLSAGLARIFALALEPALVKDARGAVRVVRSVSDYAGLVGAAFDQIRESAGGKPSILIRLSEALERLAVEARSPEQRAALLDQIEKVWRAGQRSIGEGRDLEDLARRHRAALSRLGGEGP